MSVSIQAVTRETYADFTELFERRGSPSYCWCAMHRVPNAQKLGKEAKREAMRELVERGTPIGVLAKVDGASVGWCSAGPRESYVRLENSRTMPRVSSEATWTILCLFVVRAHRGKGLTRVLLEGAVAEARRHGAVVVEGYPFDTAGISSTHRGHSSAFAAAGFRQDGTRWVLTCG